MRQVSCPKELRDLELWCSYCGRLVKGRNILWLSDGHQTFNAGCLHCKKQVLRAFDEALRELRREAKRLKNTITVLGELRKEVQDGKDSGCRHRAAEMRSL